MNTSTKIEAKIIQILIALIVLAGCKRVEPPQDIKVNPNPSQKYIVTVQIDDAINIQDMEAIKRYQVSNVRTCSPIDETLAIGGMWRPIEKKIHLKLNPLAHNTFQTIYNSKYFLDEAYYSMDVCHWKGYGIQYNFTKDKVLYQFSLENADITHGNQVILQCASLKRNISEGISQGCIDHQKYGHAMPGAYFVININSKNTNK
jgi:hypothetical protein